MSNTIDHENIAGEHDSKQIDSQHVDIEEEREALIRSHRPAGWYSQVDGRQRYWDGRQWTENYTPAPVTATSAEGVGKPSVRRKMSSRVLVSIFAGVTGVSLITGALVQVNTNRTVTAKNAAIAAAQDARDVASAKADSANSQALGIENQLASVGAPIQAAANTAAAKIAADKAASAARQAAIYKGFTDKLENEIKARTPQFTEVRCFVKSVNSAGAGTYTCAVVRDGTKIELPITVDANGDFVAVEPSGGWLVAPDGTLVPNFG